MAPLSPCCVTALGLGFLTCKLSMLTTVRPISWGFCSGAWEVMGRTFRTMPGTWQVPSKQELLLLHESKAGGDAGLGREMTGFRGHTGFESEVPGRPPSGQARDGCLGASESVRAGTPGCCLLLGATAADRSRQGECVAMPETS